MEGTKSLWIDMPAWADPPRVDDFVVAVSAVKSNTVYHVARIRAVKRKAPSLRVTRYAMRVFVSDLSTLLRRDPGQRIYTMGWYPRGKKAQA